MIVYKWVIKQNNQYFPLRNFGVDSNIKYNYNPYEIGKEYKTECKIMREYPKLYNYINSLTAIQEFHFWKENNNYYTLTKWNKFLEYINQPIINCCLICEINEQDIIIENDFQLVTSKFKVIKAEEVNNEIMELAHKIP